MKRQLQSHCWINSGLACTALLLRSYSTIVYQAEKKQMIDRTNKGLFAYQRLIYSTATYYWVGLQESVDLIQLISQ